MRILCVVGTRPNFIKMAALFQEMRQRPWIEPVLVHTGQHHDQNMSDVFFAELELPRPDIYLDISGGSNTWQTAHIMARFEKVIHDARPDLVVVVGDVNSTLAAGLVARQCGIPLAHVEAGLRSRDSAMPEETNRILVDHLSDFLFVTEESGLENLKAEGVDESKIHFTGNVMIDTLLRHLEKAEKTAVVKKLGLAHRSYALVTLHRPANSDNRRSLEELLKALHEVSRHLTVVMPLHPRTRKRIEEFGLSPICQNGGGDFRLLEPLGYLEFLSAMRHARVVLTDSGGIQEETTILGVPCLTMRENTERPVTITAGTNQLVGTRRRDIIQAFLDLPEEPPSPSRRPPLWDGQAAGRIIDILEEKLGKDELPSSVEANAAQ